MANYNGNIDLLTLNEAGIYTGLDKKNPERTWYCAPTDVNEIIVKKSPHDPNRLMALLRVAIWPLNENYKAKIRQSAQERGDENVSVPTHELQLSFSLEYIKAAIKRFVKLPKAVIEENKGTHPEFAEQDPSDENTSLFKAIRRRMNRRMGMLYQPKTAQQPSPYAQPTFAAAGAAVGYVAPAEASGTDLSGYNSAEDEALPF